ncbi:MAG: DUF2141 domain-containing protein [Acidobacteriota bacterium]
MYRQSRPPRTVLAALFVLFLVGPVPSAVAADLIVTVSGAKTDEGEIGCALYASADGFPMDPEPATRQFHTPRAGSAECRFEGVEPGTYALAVSHDLNGNRRTDTGLFGIPKEAWGVSNNVRPAMRAPRFSEAAFDIGTSTVRLTVEVSR